MFLASLLLTSLSFAGNTGNPLQAMQSAQAFARSLEGKYALRGDQGCADLSIRPGTQTQEGYTYYDVAMNGLYEATLFHPFGDSYKTNERGYEFFDKTCSGVIGVTCEATRVTAKKDKQGRLESLVIKRYDYAAFGLIRYRIGKTECHR